jgi:hypothetical protein
MLVSRFNDMMGFEGWWLPAEIHAYAELLQMRFFTVSSLLFSKCASVASI